MNNNKFSKLLIPNTKSLPMDYWNPCYFAHVAKYICWFSLV